MSNINPRNLLNRVLALIEKDLTKFETTVTDAATTDWQTVQSLCKYSDALLKITQSQDDTEAAKTRKLSGMSKDELNRKLAEYTATLTAPTAPTEPTAQTEQPEKINEDN